MIHSLLVDSQINHIEDPPSAKKDTPSSQIVEDTSHGNFPPTANSSEKQAGRAKAPTETPQQETADNVPVIPSPPVPETHVPERTEEAGTSTVNGKEIEAPTPDIAPSRTRSSKSRSPQIEAAVQPNEPSSRKPRKSKSPIQPDQETADNQPEQAPRKSISPRTKRGKQPKSNAQETPSDSAEAPEASHAPTANSTVGLDASDVAVNGKRIRAKAATGKKVAREVAAQVNGNRSKSPSTEEALPDTASESQDQQDQPAQPSNIAKGKRPRRKPSPAKDSNDIETESQSQSPADPAPTAGESSTTGVRQTRKPAKRKKTQPEPEPNPGVDEEPEAESGKSKSRKGRSGGKSKRALEQQAEPEEEAPQELERAMEPEPPKQRRGQGKKANRRTRTEASPTQELPEAEAETSRPTQRKPREPRGETVPVTIHRLVNASALGAFDISANDPGEEGDRPTDESSNHQKAKLPNRGGVNPADVLSQICRETLEKTLTTLKTGIENETNAARRAEWSRKRKAVETFGVELDGRLLDLSEILDSNFVLGVQLKKAKRDMMEMRSHLHQVRREREGIALQMDRVRSRHMQKENEKTVGCCYTPEYDQELADD